MNVDARIVGQEMLFSPFKKLADRWRSEPQADNEVPPLSVRLPELHEAFATGRIPCHEPLISCQRANAFSQRAVSVMDLADSSSVYVRELMRHGATVTPFERGIEQAQDSILVISGHREQILELLDSAQGYISSRELPTLIVTPDPPSREALASFRSYARCIGMVVTVSKVPLRNRTYTEIQLINSRTKTSPRSILVHVHLPKNGGSTIKAKLHKAQPGNHVEMYTFDPMVRYGGHDILTAATLCPDATIFSSHSFREYPPALPQLYPHYFCFIRHPVERHLSYFRYCRKYWKTLTPQHRRQLPQNFMSMEIGDYFEWLDRRDRELGTTANRQTLYLSGGNNVSNAIGILERFLFVGVTDEMTESVRQLNRRLDAAGFSFRLPENAEVANSSADIAGLTDEAMAVPAVQHYMASISSDLALYEWAKARLHEGDAREIG